MKRPNKLQFYITLGWKGRPGTYKLIGPICKLLGKLSVVNTTSRLSEVAFFDNSSFTFAKFVGETVSDSDTRQSHDSTDTGRIIAVYVILSKVAKASTIVTVTLSP
jgi:hypothetical protein